MEMDPLLEIYWYCKTVNTLCNLLIECLCHRQRSQEQTCQWQMKDFFSRCGLEISSNSHLCLSSLWWCDLWEMRPPPTFSLSLLVFLSPSPFLLLHHTHFLMLPISCLLFILFSQIEKVQMWVSDPFLGFKRISREIHCMSEYIWTRAPSGFVSPHTFPILICSHIWKTPHVT